MRNAILGSFLLLLPFIIASSSRSENGDCAGDPGCFPGRAPWLSDAEAPLPSEGRLLIHRTCAEDTGCFPGDEPGFPVTITESGSYLLTSNIHHREGRIIEIKADNVSLDLNGFQLSTHEYYGRVVFGSGSESSVKNGSVKTGIEGGISLGGHNMRVEDLHVISYSEAVGCGNSCVIESSTIGGEGGILCGNDCQVIHSDISGNVNSSGITAGERLQVIGSNVRVGVKGGDGSLITSSTLRLEDGGGTLRVGASSSLLNSHVSPLPSLIVGPASNLQGNAIDCAGEGEYISIGAGTRFSGNTVANCDYPFTFGAANVGFRNNVFTNNNGGDANPQTSGGTDLGGNLCGTRTTCP